MEDRKKPIDFVLHVMGGFHDVCFEQRINHCVFTGFMVNMMDTRCENFVLAVFAPGLRQTL